MDNTYIDQIREQILIFRENSLRRRILEFLLDYPDGIELNKALKLLNIKIQQLTDIRNGIKVRSKLEIKRDYRNIIKLVINTEKIKPAHIIHNSDPIDSNNSSLLNLPKSYMEKLKHLPEYDKKDVLDMLKKAYYYQKSAISLIDANELTNTIHNHIFN